MDTVKLYFPSVDKTGKPLESLESTLLYKKCCSWLSLVNGGCTTYPVKGSYINANKQLINDDISLIVSFTDKLEQSTNLMRILANEIRVRLNQESVLIEINDHIEFITSENSI